MGRINLYGLQFYACHGALSHEMTVAQEFQIDVRMKVNVQVAGETDSLKDTVHYGLVVSAIERVMKGPSVHLLETLAYRIRAAILALDPKIEAVAVRVRKVNPPIGMASHGAEVEIDFDD